MHHTAVRQQPRLVVAHMEKLYLAYLLRLWQATSDERTAWRATLENPHTGERHAFATLGALFAFLDAETTAIARRDTSGSAMQTEDPL